MELVSASASSSLSFVAAAAEAHLSLNTCVHEPNHPAPRPVLHLESLPPGHGVCRVSEADPDRLARRQTTLTVRSSRGGGASSTPTGDLDAPVRCGVTAPPPPTPPQPPPGPHDHCLPAPLCTPPPPSPPTARSIARIPSSFRHDLHCARPAVRSSLAARHWIGTPARPEQSHEYLHSAPSPSSQASTHHPYRRDQT